MPDEAEGEAVDLVAVDDFLPTEAVDDEDASDFPEPDGDGFTIVPPVEWEAPLVVLLDDEHDDDDDGDDCERGPPVLPLVGVVVPFAMLPALRLRLGNMAPGSVFFAGVMVGLTFRCCPSPVLDEPLPLLPWPDLC